MKLNRMNFRQNSLNMTKRTSTSPLISIASDVKAGVGGGAQVGI